MAYEQAQKPAPKEHTLNMLNREKLSLTGVADVSGFDENVIVLVTSLGPLTVRGESLHIERANWIHTDKGAVKPKEETA